MTYEGVTLENGLVVKNGEIMISPDLETARKQSENLIQRINSGPLPQTVAKRKAAEEAKLKKRK